MPLLCIEPNPTAHALPDWVRGLLMPPMISGLYLDERSDLSSQKTCKVPGREAGFEGSPRSHIAPREPCNAPLGSCPRTPPLSCPLLPSQDTQRTQTLTGPAPAPCSLLPEDPRRLSSSKKPPWSSAQQKSPFSGTLERAASPAHIPTGPEVQRRR